MGLELLQSVFERLTRFFPVQANAVPHSTHSIIFSARAGAGTPAPQADITRGPLPTPDAGFSFTSETLPNQWEITIAMSNE
jgi:hypothetical protein